MDLLFFIYFFFNAKLRILSLASMLCVFVALPQKIKAAHRGKGGQMLFSPTLDYLDKATTTRKHVSNGHYRHQSVRPIVQSGGPVVFIGAFSEKALGF